MTASHPVRAIYSRLALALLLPLVVAGLLGLGGWHAWQQQQAALALQETVQQAIASLKARQAAYLPGGSGYQQYLALLDSGFAAPLPTPALRKLIDAKARHYDIAVTTIEIGESQPLTEPAAGLALTGQAIEINAHAPSDHAVLRFIDALRRGGGGELTLEKLRLASAAGTIEADIDFSSRGLSGAPHYDHAPLPVPLPDPLGTGKALLAADPTAASGTTAAMILKVETAGQ